MPYEKTNTTFSSNSDQSNYKQFSGHKRRSQSQDENGERRSKKGRYSEYSREKSHRKHLTPLQQLGPRNNINPHDRLIEQCKRQEKLITDLNKQGKTIKIECYTKYLSLLKKTKNYEEAERLFNAIPEKECDIVTLTTVIKAYAEQGKYEEAERLFNAIPEKECDIFTLTTMIKVYAKQGKYEKAERLFNAILEKERTIVTLTTMINVYAEQGKYEKAERLFNAIPEKECTIVTLTTMIKVYAEQGIYEKSEELFKKIPHNTRTLVTYLVMSKILLQNFNHSRLEQTQNLFSEMQAALTTLKSPLDYREGLRQVMQRNHQWLELITLKKHRKSLSKNAGYSSVLTKLQANLSNFAKALQRLIVQQEIINPTLGEAWLIHYYLPHASITPNYQELSTNELQTIKEAAYAQLNHRLAPLAEKTISITEVDISGKKVGEYRLTDSIYQELTQEKLPNYLIVKLDKPLKPSRIPLFIRYEDQIYRTDVLGGSKLKSSQGKKCYGSLIAVPLESAEFFKEWFTSEESFWYGQRAFLPEKADQKTPGLKGEFKIALIPDALNYTVKTPFIVQDGWGYIKASASKNMELNKPLRPKEPVDASYLTYQAMHAYSAKKYPAVVKELLQEKHKALYTLKCLLQKSKLIPILNGLLMNFIPPQQGVYQNTI